jgi:hypothetical protein
MTGESKEYHENLHQDSLCPSRDSKLARPEYKSEMLYFNILLQLALEFIFGFVYHLPCNNVKI